MKTKNILGMVLFCTMLAVFACTKKVETKSGTMKILDTRNGKEPEEKSAGHKAYDVQVIRTDFMGNGYKAIYYRQEKDSLNYHSATLISDEDFDNADYIWKNDSTVQVKIYNSTSKNQKIFTAWGNEGRSSMSDVK